MTARPASEPAQLYRHSGLLIRSAVDIPEWAPFALPAGAAAVPDVEIVRGLPDPDRPARPDEQAFDVEGVADYLIAGGNRIHVRPAAGADPDHWRLFLLGSAWGILGYQRGFAMWHGSAVEHGGRAVLLCGASGAGKSTLAAALVSRGAQLVADDLSRIEVATEGAVIHPSSARLKLWREAIDRLGWQDRILRRDWLREDKFLCAVPDNLAGQAPRRLAGIVVLEDAARSEMTRLTGADALAGVLQGTLYRPGAIERLGQWPAQGALAAQVLARVPVWRLRRPRDFARLDEGARLVEELWTI